MIGRRSADAQRPPYRIQAERPLRDSNVKHCAHHDLGLALAVQALGAQIGEDHVDPVRRQLAEPHAIEAGNDKLAQHALVLVERGPVEPPFGSQLPQPEVDQSGYGRLRGDAGVHWLLLRDRGRVALVLKVCSCYLATSRSPRRLLGSRPQVQRSQVQILPPLPIWPGIQRESRARKHLRVEPPSGNPPLRR
jgi:hypothetical protein